MKKLLALVFALFGVCFITSCGNKEDNPTPPVDEPTEKTQYTVTFNSQGGSQVADAKSDKTTGKVTKPTDPTKTYYTFEGWFKEEACTTAFDFNAEVTANTTAYAKWTLIEESMSYADFMALEAGDSAIIEGYIAAKQSWWSNKATMYLTTDTMGEGFFLYEFKCTEEEYNNVYKIGTKIQVYGEVATYAGEMEIVGDSIDYELTNVIENATKPNTIIDVTSSVKSEDLEDIQNAYFSATLKVKEYTTTDQNTGVAASKAYGYKGDAPTDDLYLLLEDASGNVLACCVEYYLTSSYASVKAVVETLAVGDTVKIEGFMYWYNGANPHITLIKKVDADVTYETFMSTPDGEAVEVYGYLVAKTTYYNGKTNLYLCGGRTGQDDYTTGEGYYVYNYSCTQEQFDALTTDGDIYLKVTGTKASYAGMQEITNATVEIIEKPEGYGMNLLCVNAPAEYPSISLTQLNENYMSSCFMARLKVKEYTTTDQNTGIAESKAYGYKGDTPTDDLYLLLEDEAGNVLACCIEAYVDYEALDLSKNEYYETIKSLNVGDVVDLQGFMYWYNGANPHILYLEVASTEA